MSTATMLHGILTFSVLQTKTDNFLNSVYLDETVHNEDLQFGIPVLCFCLFVGLFSMCFECDFHSEQWQCQNEKMGESISEAQEW